MLIHNCLARHVAKWDLWSNFSPLWVMSKLTLIQLWSMRGPKASKDSKGNYSTIVFNFWWEMDSVHRCNFWSKLTILFVVEHHTLMLNSTWNLFARPQKNSGRITQCLASRSRLPKVYNFWGFSFLRRKLAGFCTDFHELFMKKIQHKCTYEHDNWRRHTDKSVALLKHCTLREFQSSLTDFTMPKSSCVAAAWDDPKKLLLCCQHRLSLATELLHCFVDWKFFLEPREDHWSCRMVKPEDSLRGLKTLILGCWKRRSWFWTRNPTFIVWPYTETREGYQPKWKLNLNEWFFFKSWTHLPKLKLDFVLIKLLKIKLHFW